MVEFAILAPLLFLLIFGIIEMSRAMFAYTTVWSAAREGARFATTVEADSYVDCSGIRSAALAKTVATDAAASNVFISYFDADGNPIADCQGGTLPTTTNVVSGSQIVVSVQNVTFDSVVPILEIFLDGLTLDSSQTRTIFVSQQVGGG